MSLKRASWGGGWSALKVIQTTPKTVDSEQLPIERYPNSNSSIAESYFVVFSIGKSNQISFPSFGRLRAICSCIFDVAFVTSDFFYFFSEEKIFYEVKKMEQFNYEKYWEMEEKEQIYCRRATQQDKIADLPVSPVITILENTKRRIEHNYNLAELEEEGIKINELLQKYTEIQLLDFIELNECEPSITMEEVEFLLLEGLLNFEDQIESYKVDWK